MIATWKDSWPLCFAGEREDGTPRVEIWCSSRSGTGDLDFVVHVHGELCTSTAAGVLPALESLAGSASAVALDLSEISFIDASGLMVLDRVIACFARSGTTCSLTRTGPTFDRYAARCSWHFGNRQPGPAAPCPSTARADRSSQPASLFAGGGLL